MSSGFLVFLGILGAIALLLITLYNRIIKLIQTRKNAFSDIDVQLKLRHDLVPNLVETVKGYAKHEEGVFTKVTDARATALKGGSVADKASAESALGTAMVNLMAVAEAYPELKADANFRQLQNELSDIENKIAAARRFFNNATNEYNASIQQFPAVLIANNFGFKEEDFFEVSETEKVAIEKAPDVSFS